MSTTVALVNGHWFAYCDDCVLGPFKSENEAWHYVRMHYYLKAM